MTDEEAWIRFASSWEDRWADEKYTAQHAAKVADHLLKEYRKRFPKPEQPYR